MQKLSKDIVKKLIYEVIEYNQTTKELTVRDEEGKVIDTRQDFEEKDIEDHYPGEKVAKITQESIDRIIREEVQAHYGAK